MSDQIPIVAMGDMHGDPAPLLDHCAPLPPGVVLLVGDLDLTAPLHETLRPLFDAGWQVFYITGNHDTDRAERYPLLFDDHPDGNLHGRAITVDGVRIAGLGGIFRGQIWSPKYGSEEPKWRSREEFVVHTTQQSRWRGGLPLRHRSTIFPEDMDVLEGLGQVDVLITHEAPTSHRYGFAGINRAAALCDAGLLIHGHHHHAYSAVLRGGCKVRGLALGEPWTIPRQMLRAAPPSAETARTL